MDKLRKVTRNDINKGNMIALSYCQCQTVLGMFGYDCKVGYNSGIYGWNYDLYRVNRVDIVTGYNVPYRQYSNKEIKNKLITLENKIRKTNFCFSKEDYKKLQKEFLEIFKA